ncbi:MAG: protein-methionine-sulfoxide reductase catalytic subunit MsrP [Acidobacteriota bacterium]
MLIRKRASWKIPENTATDELLYFGRRRFLQSLALVAAGTVLHAGETPAAPTDSPRPPLYPAPRSDRYKLDRPLSDEAVVGRSVIFDEISSNRSSIAAKATSLAIRPWSVQIGGAVKKQKRIDVDDLVRQIGIEERLYRHRCVEAWAMAVPWTGIPLKKFVEFAEPTSSARYLRMVSVAIPDQLPGWYESKRVFPYYEAITLTEATNELALLATGIYGHPLPPHHGAPIRLVVPWKYGFKSIKSIAGFEFTAEKPSTFWNDLSPSRFAWSSNVDPTETNPWPQNEETILGTEEKTKTQLFNGYGDFVADLYK